VSIFSDNFAIAVRVNYKQENPFDKMLTGEKEKPFEWLLLFLITYKIMLK